MTIDAHRSAGWSFDWLANPCKIRTFPTKIINIMKRIIIPLIVLLISCITAAAEDHKSNGSFSVTTDEDFNLVVEGTIINKSKKYTITTLECTMYYGDYLGSPNKVWKTWRTTKMSLAPGEEQAFSLVFPERLEGFRALYATITRVRYSDGYIEVPYRASYYL